MEASDPRLSPIEGGVTLSILGRSLRRAEWVYEFPSDACGRPRGYAETLDPVLRGEEFTVILYQFEDQHFCRGLRRFIYFD